MIKIRLKLVDDDYTKPGVLKVEANPFHEVRCVLQYREGAFLRKWDGPATEEWTDWETVEITDES